MSAEPEPASQSFEVTCSAGDSFPTSFEPRAEQKGKKKSLNCPKQYVRCLWRASRIPALTLSARELRKPFLRLMPS